MSVYSEDIEVAASMRDSDQWTSVVLPFAMNRVWPGATWTKSEYDNSPSALMLDRDCGIDYLVKHERRVYGVSVRCQAWNHYANCVERYGDATFTIRDERIGSGYRVASELQKTMAAIESGAITAAYQLHGYVDALKNENATTCIGYGLAQRVPLFQYVHVPRHDVIEQKTHDKQRRQWQTFKAITFARVNELDALIDSYTFDCDDTPLTLPSGWRWAFTASRAFIQAFNPIKGLSTERYKSFAVGRLLKEIQSLDKVPVIRK